jgi:hypothetical protein
MEKAAGSTVSSIVSWVATAWIVYIFIWYLQYKFLGHPGSVELFTTITDWLGLHGHEKAMRIGTGSCELLCSIILLLPGLQGLGGLGAVTLMTGALVFHLASPLGIDPYNDGGVLFKQACSVWVCGVVIAVLRREQLRVLAFRLRQLRARTA